MTDGDKIPENIDLRFIAAQLGKVLDGQREMRDAQGETNERLGKVEGTVAELQVGLAAVSVDLKAVKKDVEDLKETSSLIEGRLVRIERQLGYVKA